MYLDLQSDPPTSEVSTTGMLTVAEDILQDVEAESILLNGEVVRRAFEALNHEPPEQLIAVAQMPSEELSQFCCQYAKLAEEYKKSIGIAESARLRMLSPLTESEKRQPVWVIRPNRFREVAGECNRKRDELQARLNEIWPCLKCFLGERCD